jgi:cyclophilin family peptidyl-prolyl cis-trans isomerase
MARMHEPDSATSQFFINLADNSPILDAGGNSGPDGYAVFGKVISGMDVVDKIGQVKTAKKETHSGSFANVPVDNVVVISVSQVSASSSGGDSK